MKSYSGIDYGRVKYSVWRIWIESIICCAIRSSVLLPMVIGWYCYLVLLRFAKRLKSIYLSVSYEKAKMSYQNLKNSQVINRF